MKKLLVVWMFGFALILAGCGGDDGSSSGGGNNRFTASLENTFKNVKLTAGQQTEVKFTHTSPLPAPITSYKDLSINIADTMQYVTISSNPLVKKFDIFDTLKMFAGMTKAMADSTGQVTAFISYAGDPDVCSSPVRYGPYNFTVDIGVQPTSQTSSVSPNAATIDIINAGSFEICIIMISPIDAYLNVSDVSVDLIPCDLPPAQDTDILGTWTGTYQCTNFGTPDEQGPIELTITKNADGSYHYTDHLGAAYDGHLCGNNFKFNGGVPGSYTESGTLILNSDGTGSKTSIWNSIPPGIMGGNCTDSLNKM